MRRIAVVCMAVLAAFAVFAAVRQDASSETYSQVVDNSDKGRFAASKSWKKSDSGKSINGDDYRFARPAKKGAHALFKVAIPADGEYAVYARWPEVPGLNDKARVGVDTAYGIKWTEVDQRRDGGLWVRIGQFEMRKGDEYSVRVSHDTRGKGNVAADAVKVESISSYEEAATTSARTENSTSSEEMRTASATGASVVQAARKYIGTPYGPKPHGGGLAYCKPYKMMDCSCLTRVAVYDSLRKTLPDDPTLQYRYGTYVAKAYLRPGDLVFHKEAGAGGPITSVGVYSGNGKFIHASTYFGKVVESQMKYVRGYYGAKRLV